MALKGGALGWVICGGLAAACASKQKRDAPVVDDLRISGNEALSDREIKKKILTSETSWIPFARKKHFDPVAWQADLQRIERLYVSRGHYQAEVVKDRVVRKPDNEVELEVEVSEGKPTTIGEMAIRGLESLSEAERGRVLEDLPLVPGEVFVEPEWGEAQAGIKRRLRNLGFAKAKVEGAALVDVGTQRAALTIEARPGRRYRFGDIRVEPGPDPRIQPFLVWEQVRLAIPEGEAFSDEALDEAQRRVFAMGVFATVKIAAGEPDEESGRIPIEVGVREGPFRTLRLGGGARVDAIRNEARLIGEWAHRDFLGGMRRLTIRAEAGWAFIPNTYAVVTNDAASGPRHGPIARLRFEFEQPRFLGRPSLRERTTLEGDRTLEQAYNAVSARLANGVIWRPRSTLSIFPAHHLETSYLNGPPVAGAATAPLTLGCETDGDSCLIWLSYLQEVVTWDRRDSPLDPRRGAYASLSLQQGGGPLGGDFTYFRVLPDARAYLSFGDDDELTLSGRIRIGELYPSSGEPTGSAVVTRFYAGGGMSMRGFSDRRLSPLLLAPAPGDPNLLLTMPIGGNGLIDGSFEARYTVAGNFRLAGFVDFGQVTAGRLGLGDVTAALWAVGLGIRYLTPIGPIRVDFARRLPFGRLPPLFEADASGAIVQVPYQADDSCFGLFGSSNGSPVPDTLCALHISIGEAF